MAKKTTAPPAVRFRDIDPLQDYYHAKGEWFSVARLVDETKHLKPFDCPLAALDLTDTTWDDHNLLGIAFQVHKVFECDLKYPIILSWDGKIADGRHRVIKALAKGHTTIRAVRMDWKPQPDKVDPEE